MDFSVQQGYSYFFLKPNDATEGKQMPPQLSVAGRRETDVCLIMQFNHCLTSQRGLHLIRAAAVLLNYYCHHYKAASHLLVCVGGGVFQKASLQFSTRSLQLLKGTISEKLTWNYNPIRIINILSITIIDILPISS